MNQPHFLPYIVHGTFASLESDEHRFLWDDVQFFVLCGYTLSGGRGGICACLCVVVCVGEHDWCSINVVSTPLFQVSIPLPS